MVPLLRLNSHGKSELTADPPCWRPLTSAEAFRIPWSRWFVRLSPSMVPSSGARSPRGALPRAHTRARHTRRSSTRITRLMTRDAAYGARDKCTTNFFAVRDSIIHTVPSAVPYIHSHRPCGQSNRPATNQLKNDQPRRESASHAHPTGARPDRSSDERAAPPGYATRAVSSRLAARACTRSAPLRSICGEPLLT